MILETADSASGHPGAAGAKSGKRKSAGGASRAKQATQSEAEIKDRLDQLAEQLNDLTQQNQDTAVSSFIQSSTGADAGSLEAMIDRIEATERRSDAALDEVNQRLQVMADQLSDPAIAGMPTRPEDVPGFAALDTALRNIVDHIGISEQRTAETLNAVQERMADIAARATSAEENGIESNAPAIVSLELRVNELAKKLDQGQGEENTGGKAYVDASIDQLSQRIDAVHHSSEAFAEQAQAVAARSAQEQGQQIEDRLRSVIEEMRAGEQESPQVAKLHGEVESLNQRFDDIKADTASERDVQTLRTAIEKLTGQISTGPDLSSIGELERRLGELAAKFEQGPGPDGLPPQMSELEQRVQALDEKLQQAMSQQPDGSIPANDLMTQIASVNERLSATEQKLGALETIERSISQLFESVEQNRVWAKEAAEEAASRAISNMPADQALAEGFAPSSELQALQEGLGAVKASADLADQRNQETLEAVHDTLEQIIVKLTDLEQQPDQAPTHAGSAINPLAQANPVEAPIADPGTAAMGPSDLPDMTPQPAAPEEFAATPVPAVDQVDDQTQMAGQDQHAFVAGQADTEIQTTPEDMQPPLADPVADTGFDPNPVAEASPPPQPEPDREDFIAAARRAAQSASSSRSVLGGLTGSSNVNALTDDSIETEESKEDSKFSLSFLRRKKAQSEEPESIIPANPISGIDAEEDDKAVNSKRRQLILAGLILLAAVSAYSLGGIGKKGVMPKSEPAKTSELGQQQSSQQVQDSLTQAQGKVSKADKTSMETVAIGSQAQKKDAEPSATGMTSIEKTVGPYGELPDASEMTSEMAAAEHVETASLSPVSNSAAKFDQEDELPIGTNQTASIEMPPSPPKTPADKATTAGLTSATPTTADTQASLLPAEIGTASLRQAAVSGVA
ncbi:MAG: hypothetical protein ACR2OM_01630, partial [Aestuariivirgaceae bacterium]